MRGHDQTSGRVFRIRAWGCVVAVAALATGPALAQAQYGLASAEPGFASPSADPIDLAADRMRDWKDGKDHWVVLDGQAAVLQGVDGVRAERAVVKVSPQGALGKIVYRVEVYAEGKVQATDKPGKTLDRLRASFASAPGPVLKPYSRGGLMHVEGPPRAYAALLARGFPTGPDPRQVAARSVGSPIRPPSSRGAASFPSAGIEPAPHAEAAPARAPSPVQPTSKVEPAPKVDPAVRLAQFSDDPIGDAGAPPGNAVELPADEPAQEPNPAMPEPSGPAIEVEPLPPEDVLPGPERAPSPPGEAAPAEIPQVVTPYTQRSLGIFPRDSGPNYRIETLPTQDGTSVVVVRGGVNLIMEDRPGAPENERRGTIDISADSAVIWKGPPPAGGKEARTADGQEIVDTRQRLEVYVEGNVVFRQDERKVAGNGDQKTYRANRAYYDVRTERFIALDAELDIFAPGLVAPLKNRAPRIQQFAPLQTLPDGRTVVGNMRIYSDKSSTTGSRFPNPGYLFSSKSFDLIQERVPLTNPRTGAKVANTDSPNQPQDTNWLIDARQNVFFMGPVPVFYWPRILTDPDDIDPPLRNITPRFNNYFGQQLLTDWNGFKLLGLQKPRYVGVDTWNIDIDYLSRRKSLALGSEFGYFGDNLISDIAADLSPDKYQRGFRPTDLFPGISGKYFGYLDFWGLDDHATDVLGSGPAVVTYGPPGFGKRGFQRINVPTAQQFRGHVLFRHMQSLMPSDSANREDEDFRLQLEAGYITDRNFLEQYYKRLFDTGLDQETLAYLLRQKQNTAWSVLAEGNLQNWYTETQWLPKLDYYRLGDSLLGDRFTYFTNTGVDYANTHTAVEVNNPNIFAFLPYDPVSNTSGPLRTGRLYTSHELDMPLNFEFLRVVPYVQGQFVGWDNQLGGERIGRLWGAAGARANVMAWKLYPNVDSELFNVHGLNHKINFDADYRDAWSNTPLNRIGVQDDLDDNTYEYARRYFALTNYAGGILPAQYDPRFLTLRRGISPITGTTDIQASMQTLHMGIHQRLQTKRGPEGRRRIIDYMVLDLDTTFFPQASRDNFGKSFGQNMYNWEWYVGDRTSLYSYGWFEFFDINGQALMKTNPKRHNDPFGITVITSGITINRPPRGNITFGYSIINTGTIATSALNVIYSYWFSPKWYGAFGTSYDFGNAVLLGSTFAVTRIGSDYLTTLGLSVDPQRNSFTFGFELAPRLSPNIRLGSTAGLYRFDSRFAPTQ